MSAMNEIVRVADDVRARAERAEAAAFDREYELGRRAERVLTAITADGRARARQWAEDDRRAERDEADRRFDPEPDEPDAAVPSAGPPRSAGRRPGPAAADGTDDEEEEPPTWLR